MSESLTIHTLGSLAIHCGNNPVTGLASRKAEALLVYLAANPRPHPRETLAEMLWDERSQSQAMANLRVVLSSLRKEVGEYVVITRESTRLNPEAPVWYDVAEFEARVQPILEQTGTLHPELYNRAAEGVALYRGDFFEGVSLKNCRVLEDWIVRERERLHHKVVAALGKLASHALESGAYQAGIAHCHRLLELDPLVEAGHRRMMRLLALSGQRGAAMAQYEDCQRILKDELGIEPEAETIALYHIIRKGELTEPKKPGSQVSLPRVHLPTFLREDAGKDVRAAPLFVTRERELERLDGFLARVLAGEGQVVFVCGGPGRGKTALVEHFARRSMERHKDLLVVGGHCDAYTGSGDPYRPFRAALEMLAGDVESRWAAGAVTTDQANRLWESLNVTGRAITHRGEDLFGTFIHGSGLLARVEAAGLSGENWAQRLRERYQNDRRSDADLGQAGLFDQVSKVLGAVAKERALILTLDDLQWADRGSLDLLAHIGRDLAGARILILGTYRAEEVALGRDGERHPLEKVLAEFKRRFGEVVMDLGRASMEEGRAFVEAFLDSEPNQFAAEFRESLFAHTQGHPLFTIELLRALQERGALVLDSDGYWVEGPELDWDILPSKVEGVIEERIGRLEAELREILTVASVEGEDFIAQVVARVRRTNDQRIIRQLSRELDKKHRLVGERGRQRIGGQKVHLYRFRHSLFQRHMYNELSGNEKELLHSEVGSVLEDLYASATDEIAPQLAWHFSEAADESKAARYLLLAGDRARTQYAFREAIEYYRHSVQKLEAISDWGSAERAYTRLGITYHNTFEFEKSNWAYERGRKLRAKISSQSILTLEDANQPLRISFQEPERLDPTESGNTIDELYVGQLFRGLFTFNSDFDPEPDMVAAWEVLDDGTRYIFQLRQDVFWSDGVRVTAKDFETAWMRLLRPDNLWGVSVQFAETIRGGWAYKQPEHQEKSRVGIRALDERTLVVELNEPVSHFLYLLGNTVTFPVPSHITNARGSSWVEEIPLVSNGAFILESWEKGKKLTLARNPTYTGEYSGNLARIEFDFEPDPEVRYRRYQNEEVDILPLSQDFVRARQDHPDEYHQAPQLATRSLYFPIELLRLSDGRVQRALKQAIDKSTLAEIVLLGAETAATGGRIPIGMPGYSKGIGLPFDPKRAQELLRQAGFPDGEGLPRLTLLAIGGPINKKVAAFLVREWRRLLNIEVTLEIADTWEDYFKKIREDSPKITLEGWVADTPDPSSMFFKYRSDAGEFSDYAQILEQARREVDPGKRLALYQEADRFSSALGDFPLTYGLHNLLIKPWVSVTWGFNIKLQNVVIEPH